MNQENRWYKKLHFQILIAMVLGFVVGILGGKPFVKYYDFFGELFLRLLKMVVVPLVFTSIVSGISGIERAGDIGKMGVKTVGYYIVTSSVAIFTGIFLVNLLKPGVGVKALVQSVSHKTALNVHNFSLKEFFLRMIPENPVKSMVASGDNFKNSPDVLGIIVFSIFIGIAIVLLKEPHKTRVKNFFSSLYEVMMKITSIIIKFAPIGVFALFAKVIAETGFSMIKPLLGYMGTVALGLFIHIFITLPVILLIFAKRNPVVYGKQMISALLTAFSTASSNATLPLTMECAENNAKIPNRVTSFVLPLGATVNMDGTALYECVAAIFVAQIYGIKLGFSDQLVIFITGLAASIGAAGIPHAGLVMMGIIFQAVGLPLSGIGMILAVDRILDMMRTMTNVWSDSVGTAVIYNFEKSGESKKNSG